MGLTQLTLHSRAQAYVSDLVRKEPGESLLENALEYLAYVQRIEERYLRQQGEVFTVCVLSRFWLVDALYVLTLLGSSPVPGHRLTHNIVYSVRLERVRAVRARGPGRVGHRGDGPARRVLAAGQERLQHRLRGPAQRGSHLRGPGGWLWIYMLCMCM